MFTGLIETTGTVKNFTQSGDFFTLSIQAQDFFNELKIGQSISVSGACLTVTNLQNNIFQVEVMRETFNKTWFGKFMKPGVKVNLERALKLTDRLDGHLVLGHVDGIAFLREIHGNKTREAIFEPNDKNLLRGIVSKGSVAIDGVSLTVIDVTDKNFSVGLIPETLKFCTLGNLKSGSCVNLETDILGKYVARLLDFKNSDFKNSKFNGDYLTSLLSL